MDTAYYPGTYTTADDPRISKGYRVRVVQDEDAEDPRGWGDHITTDSDEYKRWAAGDVYGVIVEHREIYVNARDTSNQRVLWDEVAYRGDNYLDPECDAVAVASEIAPESVTL